MSSIDSHAARGLDQWLVNVIYFIKTHAQRLCCGFVIVLSCVLCSSPVWALQAQKEQADSVLMSDGCYFSGTFTQKKHIKGLDQAAESSGQFVYSCDRGVIWSTDLPQSDTLVLRSAQPGHKSAAYRIVDQKIERLKSRQSRFLTELIMNLMGADRTALESHFEIETTETGALRLFPIKRQMKRAIQSIDVSKLSSDKTQLDESGIIIAIVDRHAERTVIEAIKQPLMFPVSLENCAKTVPQAQACGLLFRSIEQK